MILETQNLAVGYGKRRLLDKINFTLGEQQLCCLLGANGAGKTTFLKTLQGLQPALQGQVLLKQRPIQNYRQNALAKLIAYVPQAQHSQFPFLVQDMVLMGRSSYLQWYQAPTPADKQLAMQTLTQLGIAHLAQRFYPQLSGGEKQLVLIARALVQQPELLIMDEPTASLDFGNQIRLLEKIKTLQQQQLSILICTHNPLHASFLADQVAFFDPLQGFVQGGSELLTPTKLATLYQISESQLKQHLKYSILCSSCTKD